MRRGLKLTMRREDAERIAGGRRRFPDEEGTEIQDRIGNTRFASGCRRRFPDEEGTEMQYRRSARRTPRSVAEDSPMRRGLKLVEKGCVRPWSLRCRRRFPDEEGTEILLPDWETRVAQLCRRRFPDEEGTEILLSRACAGRSAAASQKIPR